MKTILLVSRHISSNPKGGPELRTFATVTALSKVSKLITYDLDRATLQKGVEAINPEFEGLQQVTRTSRIGRFLQLSEIIFQSSHRANARLVQHFIEMEKPDVIWVNFATENARLVKQLRRNNPYLPIVSDTDSVYSTFLIRTAERMNGLRRLGYAFLAHLSARREGFLLQLSNVLTAVSETDREQYLKVSPSANVQLFPNVLVFDSPSVNIEELKPDSKVVLVPGSFGGPESAMTHGAAWMMREVWPEVRSRVPEARLLFVGRNAIQLHVPSDAEGVEIASDVDSMGPFFSESAVVACPLFFESGTRFKILEAALHSIPTVSTSLGAEGLTYVNKKDIVIADSASSFADGLCLILSNHAFAQKLGVMARMRLEEKYSLEAAVISSEQVLRQLFHGSEVGGTP